MTIASGTKAQDQVSICRHAVQTGRTYSWAAADLKRQGKVDGDDPQLSVAMAASSWQVDEPFCEFVAEAERHHQDVSRSVADHLGVKSALAVQGKLIRASRQAGMGQGPGADMLALSCESVGLLLQGIAGQRRRSQRMFHLAARGIDRAILDRRHQAYDGTVSSLTEAHRLGFQEAVGGLRRSGTIASTDPRLAVAPERVCELNGCHIDSFLLHVRGIVIRHLPTLSPHATGATAMLPILMLLKQLPRKGDRVESEYASVVRHAEFMRIMGRAGETMALNFHNQADRARLPLVGELLACAVSAQDRSQVFQERAAELVRAGRAHRRTMARSEERS